MISTLPYRHQPLSIIAAISDNNVIGLNNQLPWNIPEEMKHFAQTTMGHVVVMGRKTFDSLQIPLFGRMNIIISRSIRQIHFYDNVFVASSLDDALAISHRFYPKKVFVIGGEQIFCQAIPLAQTMIISRVHQIFHGDSFFPVYSEYEWKKSSEQFCANDQIPFTITTYQRISRDSEPHLLPQKSDQLFR